MSRLIYLDAAVDVAAKWFENMGLNGDICLDGLRSLPSVQPEIIYCKDCKHHWIHRCMDSMPTEICDLDQTFYDPNCGADMRGEQDK